MEKKLLKNARKLNKCTGMSEMLEIKKKIIKFVENIGNIEKFVAKIGKSQKFEKNFEKMVKKWKNCEKKLTN